MRERPEFDALIAHISSLPVGSMQRAIVHWDVGNGFVNASALEHYNGMWDQECRFHRGHETIEDQIVTADDDYARHTRGLNTKSGGFAILGMVGAKENPFDPGMAPFTEPQFRQMCADFALIMRAAQLPITHETLLTHAEVEGTYGVKQNGKWDITRIPWDDTIRGARAVGDYMRQIVREFAGQIHDPFASYPTLSIELSGGQSKWTTEAQLLLQGHGYTFGQVDGYFGPKTSTAVFEFQQRSGLPATGIVDRMTWAALYHKATEPRPPREGIDEDFVRKGGSNTVEKADEIKVTREKSRGRKILAAIMLFVGGSVEGLREWSVNNLPNAQDWITENWVVALMIIGAAIWLYREFRDDISVADIADALIDNRVKEAQNHSNDRI
ncbi:MAG: peptidoglycan-binding domain-containing protein [Pseudomonadota bacterium]